MAGDATLGDAQALSYPWAQPEVARWFAPWFLREPRELPGKLVGLGETLGWMRRLVEPRGWR